MVPHTGFSRAEPAPCGPGGVADTGPCEHRAGTWGVCPRWEVWPSTTEMPAAAAFPPPTHASPTGSNSRLASAAGSPVYLDLAYLPGGGAGHLDQDFFLRVRALCYVISGQGQRQEEGLRAVLDALLAGKQRWDLDLQVGGPQCTGLRCCVRRVTALGTGGVLQLRSVTKGGDASQICGAGTWRLRLCSHHMPSRRPGRPVCALSGLGTWGHRPHGRVQRRPQPKGSVAL